MLGLTLGFVRVGGKTRGLGLGPGLARIGDKRRGSGLGLGFARAEDKAMGIRPGVFFCADPGVLFRAGCNFKVCNLYQTLAGRVL